MILRKISFKILFLIAPLMIWSCDEEVTDLEAPLAPTDVSLSIQIASDSSGMVTFTPSATNALTFQLTPGDGTGPETILPGESFVKNYSGVENVSFDVTLVAFGTGGAGSSISQTIDLFIKVQIDPAILMALAGGELNTTKRWIWDSDVGGVNGHFGVGDPNTDFPGFFSADANLLDQCLYDDILEFGVSVDGAPTYNLITQGVSFFNSGQIGVLFPGEGGNGDECREADDLLLLQTSFTVRSNEGGNETLILGGGVLSPLSYFANVPEWEIIELTADRLRVRGVNAAGDLAWYHQFVPEDGGGGIDPGGRVGFDNLVFSEEFDVDGAPDPSIWNIQIGDGCPDLCGWGNNESQYYTDRSENLIIEGGMLKITALREDFSGSQYTSARLNTQDKFEFTYGRVDYRARVPALGGTWPAAWMLGADLETNPWPAAGEIDV
ncbi:MAG: glycoside hydrolase family 16 protein, partial [Bacteroidota bacterium]